MQKATISEIKNHLSAYLKKVRAGESVLILERDQPVARIERIGPAEHANARLTRLEREGLVHPPKQSLTIDLLRSTASEPQRSVLEALLEERREGR
jgi:antitoxin (DNA-binding transcriptional repressor) of toxin-antitoxin stability system